MDRAKVIQALQEFNQEQGVVFLSPHEAIDYYMKLTDLICDLVEKLPTSSEMK